MRVMITSCNVLSLPFFQMNAVCTIAQVWCVEALLLETPGIRPVQMPVSCAFDTQPCNGRENLWRVATVFRDVAIDFRGNESSEWRKRRGPHAITQTMA